MTAEWAISQWIDDLDSLDTEQRKAARAHLAALGSAVVAPLIEAMRSNTARRCWNAAEVLAQIDDPRWKAPMQEALTSTHPILGQVAAKALVRWGCETVPALIAALPAAHGMIQIEIVLTLQAIGDVRAVEPLMTLLRQANSGSLRYTIIEALGALGDRRAIEVIRPFEHDSDRHVQKRVHVALERLNASQARA